MAYLAARSTSSSLSLFGPPKTSNEFVRPPNGQHKLGPKSQSKPRKVNYFGRRKLAADQPSGFFSLGELCLILSGPQSRPATTANRSRCPGADKAGSGAQSRAQSGRRRNMSAGRRGGPLALIKRRTKLQLIIRDERRWVSCCCCCIRTIRMVCVFAF